MGNAKIKIEDGFYLSTAIATKLRMEAVDAITSAATHKSQVRFDHFHSVVTFISIKILVLLTTTKMCHSKKFKLAWL